MNKQPDLILLHPPSIYDFRKRNDMLYPYIWNAAVGVSAMYEMLPIGFYHIKEYLEAGNVSVKIYNLASMMLKDWDFNVEKFLGKLKPKIFGIDLHWMIHAQGSIELAKVVKRIHGNIPILFGGMTSSYFYKELIDYPFIDFVIRGNITFQPLSQLMQNVIEEDTDYSRIANLCYKKKDKVFINGVKVYSQSSHYYANWNAKEICAKNINNFLLNTQTGCRKNCCFCGGSSYSTKKYFLQKKNVLIKQSRQVLREIDSIKRSSLSTRKKGNFKLITIVPLLDRWGFNGKIIEKAKNENLNLRLSLYNLMPIKIMEKITKYTRPVIEISPHSHDLDIRKFCHSAEYSNEQLESWIAKILNLNIRRIEIYFMIGLAHQTEESVYETVEYCEELLRRFGKEKRVVTLLAPIIPFLDPASLAYDKAGRYGYKIFYSTLKEHQQAMLSISLKKRLNYETEWMSRSKIIEVYFRSAEKLTKIKIDYGYLTPNIGKQLLLKIKNTYKLINQLDRIDALYPRKKRLQALRGMSGEICAYNKEVLKTALSDHVPLRQCLYNFWYEA